MSNIERVKSGIPGLDEMLNGGIPKGRVILVVGGPGTGKTIFCTQFLINGIKQYGEPGLFISLDETGYHIKRELASFNWDIAQLERDKMWALVDLSPFGHMAKEMKRSKIALGKREFALEKAIDDIKKGVKSVGAKRIVIDTMNSLTYQFPDPLQRRAVILSLMEVFVSTGALEREVQLEEYLAHGVIIMQTLQVGKAATRVLQIEKMRETPIDTQMRPYRINEKGIEVYPKESVF
jgi:KaiC/GvpD/RAD55 family RecA-like ATPase